MRPVEEEVRVCGEGEEEGEVWGGGGCVRGVVCGEVGVQVGVEGGHVLRVEVFGGVWVGLWCQLRITVVSG